MRESTRRTLWSAAFLVTACSGLMGGNWLRTRQDVGAPAAQPSEIFAGSMASREETGFTQSPPPQAYFDDVRRLIETDYVDAAQDETKMARLAVQYMLQELGDPQTRFYDPEEWKAYTGVFEGKYYGIGADLAVRPEDTPNGAVYPVRVVSVADGGPAARAGLQSGDWVDEINGKWVVSRSLIRDLQAASDRLDRKEITRDAFDRAFDALRKRSESMMTAFAALDELMVKPGQAKLKVIRNGKRLEFTIERGTWQVKPVEMVGDAIRIRSFSANAARDLGILLRDKAEVKLDLRGNPGGPMTSVIACLEQLLPAGGCAKLETKPGRPLIEIRLKNGIAAPKKVVVLVDCGTAREAEVFVSALKDRAAAEVVGGATFGMGQQSERFSLPDGSGYSVTSGHFMNLAGKPLFLGKTPAALHAEGAGKAGR